MIDFANMKKQEFIDTLDMCVFDLNNHPEAFGDVWDYIQIQAAVIKDLKLPKCKVYQEGDQV